MARDGKTTHKLSPLLGESPAIDELRDFIVGVSLLSRPVLLLGDEGTGKELAARKIHAVGRTAQAPFQKFDCERFSESELNELLFGGNSSRSLGWLSRPNGATVYLAQIEHGTPFLWRQLLRFLLDEREECDATPRLIFSSEFSYEELSEARILEPTLLDLISRMRMSIPPLRERVEDIPILCHYQMWLNTEPRDLEDCWIEFKGNVLPGLLQYPWPGNVNELNALVRDFCVQLIPACDAAKDIECETPDEPVTNPGEYLAGELRRLHTELLETLRIEESLGRVDMVLLPETDRGYGNHVN